MSRRFIYSSLDTFLELIFPIEGLKPFSDNFRMFLVQFYLLRKQREILVNLGLILFDDNLLHVPGRVLPVQQLG